MTRADQITIGSTIMPPPRELSLWMRRTLAEKGLPESALYLTVSKIQEGQTDKGGPWLIITATQTKEWMQGWVSEPPFRFKVRPHTPWAVIHAK